MKVWFLCALLLGLGLATLKVQACSYGADYPQIESLASAEILVRATVIENSAAWNSLLAVDSYFVGNGSRYLLVDNNSASFAEMRQRNYDFGCSYAYSPLADVGESGYFALQRDADGTYTLLAGYLIQQGAVIYFHFIGDPNDSEELYYRSNYERLILSEADFLAQISAVTDNFHISSPLDETMPRLHPLYITTSAGTSYQLPIDSLIPKQLNSIADCLECPTRLYSPDETHYAKWLDADTWMFGYTGDGGTYTESETEVSNPSYTGQALQFSPDSFQIANWDGTKLSLYHIVYGYGGNYGRNIRLLELFSLDLQVSETYPITSLYHQITWSGNHAVIAYWDAAGLWYLDFWTRSKPQLIIPMADISAEMPNLEGLPPVLELSATGRYLRYGDSQEWTLLDTVTGTRYDDAVIAPNELNIVLINPEQYCFLESCEDRPDYGICFLPVQRDTCGTRLLIGNIITWSWFNNHFYYVECEDTQQENCVLYEDSLYHQLTASQAMQIIAFEETTGLIAIATDYHLSLGTYDDTIDLSAILDSPISALEWGASLWELPIKTPLLPLE